MNLEPLLIVKLELIGGIVNDELPNTLSPGTNNSNGFVTYIVTFAGFENIPPASQAF
jgi:hypothetical protein